MGAAIRRVGFIGIGNMGWPMAANLVKAGFEVAVCDAVPGRSAQFASEVGGQAAADAAREGRRCCRHHPAHQQAGGGGRRAEPLSRRLRRRGGGVRVEARARPRRRR
jgi:3-hydroxyacyl-CoA dehydrogenase